VNTIPEQVIDDRRRRRIHSDEFKANAVALCMQPGMSTAAVAMANGINANLLRRWVRIAETVPAICRQDALPAPQLQAAQVPSAFVPMQLPAKPAVPDIRIELRRAATSITVTWPVEAAGECAAWMRELLR
jgi:transposase